MNGRRIVLGLGIALLVLPALASASARPTATGIRIGDHPGYVRVVVDFVGGTVKSSNVVLFGMTKYGATVVVNRANTQLPPASRSAYGVTARLRPGPSQVTVGISFRRGTMKYLSYAVVTGDRLAIDLWKSAPPTERTQTCGDGLSLRHWHIRPGSVAVSGTERGIFEHQFQVVVRGASGKVLGRTIGLHGPGIWNGLVHYTAARRQAGTLEAVAFTPKDGAVECLAQVRVTLPASSPAALRPGG